MYVEFFSENVSILQTPDTVPLTKKTSRAGTCIITKPPTKPHFVSDHTVIGSTTANSCRNSATVTHRTFPMASNPRPTCLVKNFPTSTSDTIQPTFQANSPVTIAYTTTSSCLGTSANSHPGTSTPTRGHTSTKHPVKIASRTTSSFSTDSHPTTSIAKGSDDTQTKRSSPGTSADTRSAAKRTRELTKTSVNESNKNTIKKKRVTSEESGPEGNAGRITRQSTKEKHQHTRTRIGKGNDDARKRKKYVIVKEINLEENGGRTTRSNAKENLQHTRRRVDESNGDARKLKKYVILEESEDERKSTRKNKRVLLEELDESDTGDNGARITRQSTKKNHQHTRTSVDKRNDVRKNKHEMSEESELEDNGGRITRSNTKTNVQPHRTGVVTTKDLEKDDAEDDIPLSVVKRKLQYMSSEESDVSKKKDVTLTESASKENEHLFPCGTTIKRGYNLVCPLQGPTSGAKKDNESRPSQEVVAKLSVLLNKHGRATESSGETSNELSDMKRGTKPSGMDDDRYCSQTSQDSDDSFFKKLTPFDIQLLQQVEEYEKRHLDDDRCCSQTSQDSDDSFFKKLTPFDIRLLQQVEESEKRHLQERKVNKESETVDDEHFSEMVTGSNITEAPSNRQTNQAEKETGQSSLRERDNKESKTTKVVGDRHFSKISTQRKNGQKTGLPSNRQTKDFEEAAQSSLKERVENKDRETKMVNDGHFSKASSTPSNNGLKASLLSIRKTKDFEKEARDARLRGRRVNEKEESSKMDDEKKPSTHRRNGQKTRLLSATHTKKHVDKEPGQSSLKERVKNKESEATKMDNDGHSSKTSTRNNNGQNTALSSARQTKHVNKEIGQSSLKEVVKNKESEAAKMDDDGHSSKTSTRNNNGQKTALPSARQTKHVSKEIGQSSLKEVVENKESEATKMDDDGHSSKTSTRNNNGQKTALPSARQTKHVSKEIGQSSLKEVVENKEIESTKMDDDGHSSKTSTRNNGQKTALSSAGQTKHVSKEIGQSSLKEGEENKESEATKMDDDGHSSKTSTRNNNGQKTDSPPSKQTKHVDKEHQRWLKSLEFAKEITSITMNTDRYAIQTSISSNIKSLMKKISRSDLEILKMIPAEAGRGTVQEKTITREIASTIMNLIDDEGNLLESTRTATSRPTTNGTNKATDNDLNNKESRDSSEDSSTSTTIRIGDRPSLSGRRRLSPTELDGKQPKVKKSCKNPHNVNSSTREDNGTASRRINTNGDPPKRKENDDNTRGDSHRASTITDHGSRPVTRTNNDAPSTSHSRLLTTADEGVSLTNPNNTPSTSADRVNPSENENTRRRKEKERINKLLSILDPSDKQESIAQDQIGLEAILNASNQMQQGGQMDNLMLFMKMLFLIRPKTTATLRQIIVALFKTNCSVSDAINVLNDDDARNSLGDEDLQLNSSDVQEIDDAVSILLSLPRD